MPKKYKKHFKYLVRRFYPTENLDSLIDSIPGIDEILERSMTSPEHTHIFNYDAFEKVGDSLLKYCLYSYFLDEFPRIQQDELHNISTRYNSKIYQAMICEALRLEEYALGDVPVDMDLKEDLVESFFGVLSIILEKSKREDLKVLVTKGFFARLFSGEEVYIFKDDVSLVTQNATIAIKEFKEQDRIEVIDITKERDMSGYNRQNVRDTKLAKFEVSQELLKLDWVRERVLRFDAIPNDYAKILKKNVTKVQISNKTDTIRLVIDDTKFLDYQSKVYVFDFSEESRRAAREGRKFTKFDKLIRLKEDLERKFGKKEVPPSRRGGKRFK